MLFRPSFPFAVFAAVLFVRTVAELSDVVIVIEYSERTLSIATLTSLVSFGSVSSVVVSLLIASI